MPQRKLGRKAQSRKALLVSLTNALIKEERIETVETKAKEAQKFAEKIITKAKKGDQHARRQVMSKLQNQETVDKLFSEIAERFADRPGGYTRVLKLAPRRGDGSPMAILELVE